jgi:uncharacterized protein
MHFISNTTLISNFAGIGKLDLLRLCFTSLYIPDQVYAEIQDGRMQGYDFYDNIEKVIFPFASSGWLQLTSLQTPEEFTLFGRLLGNLHHGEAACLAIASNRKWVFLSDDGVARKSAAKLNLSVSGTLGALLALVKRQQITIEMADEVLYQMIQKGYYSPVQSVADIHSLP